jgi:hypothetical protein
MMSEFLLNNWGEILVGFMAFCKIIVNLTPTEKDNKVFGWLDDLVTLVTGDRRKQ